MESISRPSSSVFTPYEHSTIRSSGRTQAFEHLPHRSCFVFLWEQKGTALFSRCECIIYMCGELSITAVLLCFKVLLVLFGRYENKCVFKPGVKFSKCVHVDAGSRRSFVSAAALSQLSTQIKKRQCFNCF